MFYPPTCVGLRYGRARACLGVFLGTSGSLASLKCFVRSLALNAERLRLASRDACCAGFHAQLPTRFHGDVQNPAEPPPSVAPSVVAPRARCRNVCLLRVGYASRPRLSPRLTLGGLALPRKPRVHGGRVTLSSLATHASILTPMRSTAGRPAASPPMGSSPTDSENQNPAASVSSLAPCIVGACPLDQ